MEILMFGLFGFGALIFYQVSLNQRKLKLVERKIDMLLEKQGISVNGAEFVLLEVQQALKNNKKIKVIRLYRQHTGASLKEAQQSVNDFIESK